MMDSVTYRVAGLLIQALEAIALEHHDVVDSGGGDDRPTPRPNWAMRASYLLDEVREEFAQGAVE